MHTIVGYIGGGTCCDRRSRRAVICQQWKYYRSTFYSRQVTSLSYFSCIYSLFHFCIIPPLLTFLSCMLFATLDYPWPCSHRSSLHNIAAMKQIIMSSSRRLKGEIGLFEQGQGLLDLPAAVLALPSHRPHASLYPQRMSNLPEDCPYLWPWCRQVTSNHTSS